MIDNVDRARLEPPRLTPETAGDDLSDIAVWLISGAQVEKNHFFNENIVRVSLNEREAKLHALDFDLAEAASAHVIEHVKQQGTLPSFITSSVPHVLEARRLALAYISNRIAQEQLGKKQIIMLPADSSGCGLWRVRLPGAWMKKNCCSAFSLSVSDLAIVFDDLMKYDLIIVQRVTDYEQWRTLCALKKAGKKIVYEIDDDLFSVEPSNPSYALCNRSDVQFTVRACLDLADLVIVTTQELANALNVADKAFVYPNCIDPACFSPLRERDATRQRLFWGGSNTHNEDFRNIVGPIITLLKKRSNLELIIMGTVPDVLHEAFKDVSEDVSSRVCVVPFMKVELYLQSLMNGAKADVGLVPLKNSVFNKSKSTVKGLEYTIAGMPFVASDVPPYSCVYTHDENALLCKTKKDWISAINRLLDEPETRKRLVLSARAHAEKHFNINTEARRLANKLAELLQ